MEYNEADQVAILQRIEMKLDRIEHDLLAAVIGNLDMAQLALDLRRERDAALTHDRA